MTKTKPLGVIALAAALLAVAVLIPSRSRAGCPIQKPAVPVCQKLVCNSADGAWELVPQAAGTACDDRNACTYGDHCDGQGYCVATAIVCGPCEFCNGTSTCGKRAVGSTCPSSSNPCEAVCDGASPYCQPL